ncbi:hypothetical protein J7355_01950 [Endozoicomonas sp. G2_2]|uniref:hypothetical protein n=1 Tax=Endozoicomonas sp. G2_2 TaxID=2821092 RepID=UPI001ADCA7A5|nr:hypothetical protein [Endozoicomonas sp. G2_2]MBO9468853.1 hypothetical protein [Endozoicomonas sp. G2_2]
MFAYIKAFVAGFVSTLTFHQGLLWVFDNAGLRAASVWNMAPVPPLGVPAVVSLAFWGGLWGVLLWLLIRRALAAGYYVGAFILGAVGPTLAYLFVVQWLKGQPMPAILDGLSLHGVGLGLALNGTWGLGVAILMRVMHPPR